MSRNQLKIGWSTISITPNKPISLHGQLYHRVSEYVHDPIYATALAIENGEEQCIIVSMDMAAVYLEHTERARSEVDGINGIDAKKIVFSATHTHNSSQFMDDPHRDNFESYIGKDKVLKLELPEDLMSGADAKAFLHERIVTVILDAWENRQPGGISYASDYAAVGFNRRPVFDIGDGKTESKMYGACSVDSFLRFEGPVDHTIDMLYTWDMDRNLTGVLVDVPCPSQVFELHRFITADYWGYARSEIRERFGNINVLSICGAAGDQNPLDLVRISKDNVQALKEWNAQAGEVFRNFDMAEECQSIADRIAEAVERGYRKAKNYVQTKPEFIHTVFDMELPLRKVSKEDYEEAKKTIEDKCAQFSAAKRMESSDQLEMFEPVGVVMRWEEQKKTDKYSFQTSVIRIGEIAIATNSFELFVDYGLRIRAKCKAKQAFIFQLTNGSGGYLPTQAAIEGGSYSSKPASTKVGPEGGDELSVRFVDEINKLFED